MCDIPLSELLGSRLILPCALLSPVLNPMLCTKQALSNKKLGVNNISEGLGIMTAWPCVPSFQWLILINFCSVHECLWKYFNSKSTWDRKNPISRKNKHTKCTADPQTMDCFLRSSNETKTWSLVPLYLVTTAALTLRGSWKLTVSAVLPVTMRQALAGTSGAPGTEGKT